MGKFKAVIKDTAVKKYVSRSWYQCPGTTYHVRGAIRKVSGKGGKTILSQLEKDLKKSGANDISCKIKNGATIITATIPDVSKEKREMPQMTWAAEGVAKIRKYRNKINFYIDRKEYKKAKYFEKKLELLKESMVKRKQKTENKKREVNMYKLTQVEENLEEFNKIKPSTVDSIGDYNKIPKPHKKISREDFMRQIFDQQMPLHIECRQPLNKKGDYVGDMMLYYYKDNIYGVLRKYSIATYVYKYYVFGCDHSNTKEKTIGNCLHKYTCLDCGETWTIDSSG